MRLAGGHTTRAGVAAWRPRIVSRMSYGSMAYLAPLTLALRRPSVLPAREGMGGHHAVTGDALPAEDSVTRDE